MIEIVNYSKVITANEIIEKEKIDWIVSNTILNSFGPINAGEEYNYWEEVMLWAKSKNYFPNLTQEQFLEIARKYDSWNEFEKTCEETEYKSK